MKDFEFHKSVLIYTLVITFIILFLLLRIMKKKDDREKLIYKDKKEYLELFKSLTKEN